MAEKLCNNKFTIFSSLPRPIRQLKCAANFGDLIPILCGISFAYATLHKIIDHPLIKCHPGPPHRATSWKTWFLKSCSTIVVKRKACDLQKSAFLLLILFLLLASVHCMWDLKESKWHRLFPVATARKSSVREGWAEKRTRAFKPLPFPIWRRV